jgi:selenocysteine-specific elongation factor
LSAGQRQAREDVLSTLASGGATPPAIDETLTALPPRETGALLDMMREAGEIVSVGGTFFHADAVNRMREILVRHGTARAGEISIPELRDELGTTRKFLIPLLEHFDAEGLTARRGERRVLRRREEDA